MFKKICAMLMVPLTAAFVAGCEVDVQDEGELPTYDLEPDEAPETDVEGDIDVENEPPDVAAPDVDVEGEVESEVETETETFDAPDINPDVDVDAPDDPVDGPDRGN